MLVGTGVIVMRGASTQGEGDEFDVELHVERIGIDTGRLVGGWHSVLSEAKDRWKYELGCRRLL